MVEGTEQKNQKQPHTSRPNNFDQGTKAIQRRKNSLSTNGAE